MKTINDILGNFDNVINSAKNGNFDEVLSKTKSYAERATRRSAERLEISRKKIEMLDSKTKLSKAYEKYGKLMYALYEGEEPAQEEVDSCLAEIQLQKTRGELLDEEIRKLRELFTEMYNSDDEDNGVKEAKESAPEVKVETVEPTE